MPVEDIQVISDKGTCLTPSTEVGVTMTVASGSQCIGLNDLHEAVICPMVIQRIRILIPSEKSFITQNEAFKMLVK